MSAVEILAAEVATLLDTAPSRILVGITGPPGAGKSTVAQELLNRFEGASYVPMDGFHLSNAVLEALGRRERKGAIDTFDAAGYLAALRRIAEEYGGGDVYVPAFERRLDEPVAAGHVVPAASRLVLTEGNYLALPDGDWAGILPLLNRLYYVDCPAPVRRVRLVQRHIDGGRTPQAAHAWVDMVDEPNARLIETSKARCDLVVDGC